MTVRHYFMQISTKGNFCEVSRKLNFIRRREDSLRSSINFRTFSEVPGSASGTESLYPKIVVFGGRGFVGSHICKEALNSGLKVIGISRSGTSPITNESWTREVEWVRGNVLEPKTYQSYLKGAVAAISCVGGFGNQEDMLKINGTANVTAVETAKAEGVPRYVFISATIPNLPGLGFILSGYVNGKAQAEDAVRRNYPDTGVSLRPGVVYGDRVISSSLTIPLGYAFQPLESLLLRAPKNLVELPVVGGLFVPPINVEAVARAAVAAATDSSVPAGIMDVSTIQNYK
ncbi:hypothetical protein CEUSTIGMA_g222.t1 [Chlamydomonas eustigma]|uniref:NAD(P)-binding domain-containing protein n=1 Tax=Chlamydomonas eustigma TaxID=1157962 RepID=A0A250WPZ3_9CHLO|nr:hypothetical protein CEUSTIGMA_g222.t1 [Chlamydomonas eustigma]|eukprot:GAX72766.1 hypothetical protein CEUSTIGMA_g222.t1 [Chlamydomonas eustigma]